MATTVVRKQQARDAEEARKLDEWQRRRDDEREAQERAREERRKREATDRMRTLDQMMAHKVGRANLGTTPRPDGPGCAVPRRR